MVEKRYALRGFSDMWLMWAWDLELTRFQSMLCGLKDNGQKWCFLLWWWIFRVLNMDFREWLTQPWCQILLRNQKSRKRKGLWGLKFFPPFSRERNAFGGNKALHVPVDGATDTGISALLNMNFCLPWEGTNSISANLDIINPRLFLIVFHLFRHNQS